MPLEIVTSEAFLPGVIVFYSMDPKYSRFLHYRFSYLFFLCVWPSFLPPFILLFAVIYFLFSAKMRHWTRNIQIYAHTHGTAPAYYLWNLDPTLPDCLQHFVRLPLRPGVWHGPARSRKAFPGPCLVCQLRSSDWQSRRTLRWSSPPSPCQGNRWNGRNRNQ